MSEAALPKDLLSPGRKRGLLALVVLGVVTLLIGAAMDCAGVYSGVLIGFLFIIDLGLGGVLFVVINNAAAARWDAVFRRVPEAMATTLLGSAGLVLVFLWAVSHVYPWARPGFMDNPIPELAGKKDWLSVGSFSSRALVYVAIWTGMLCVILRKYWAQDRDGVDRTTIIRRLSMLFLVLFAYSFSLACFDWLMSLEPTWYSAIFAVYCFGGVMQCGLAVTLLLVLYLDAKGVFQDKLREQHLHDLGKWMFAWSVFWAYIWFFQYMLTWYADLPGENQYYLLRSGHWAWMMVAVVVGRFAVPFFGLASQRVKKDRRVLATVAAVVIFAQWLDLVLMVLPSQGTMRNPFALLLPLATGAGFVLLFFRAFRGRPALRPADAAMAYSSRYLT
ncbi:MAG TPA: hypothetical protein VK914_08730 [bacterium]|jgi:hypothetical protein|nr:hypothetical protein [bacterium]